MPEMAPAVFTHGSSQTREMYGGVERAQKLWMSTSMLTMPTPLGIVNYSRMCTSRELHSFEFLEDIYTSTIATKKNATIKTRNPKITVKTHLQIAFGISEDWMPSPYRDELFRKSISSLSSLLSSPPLVLWFPQKSSSHPPLSLSF